MKYLTAAAAALATLGSVVFAQHDQAPCQNIYTRPELLSMSSSQWDMTKDVLTSMHREGWFSWFSHIHTVNFLKIQGNSQFFPFHRRIVYEWEKVARQYNSEFVQPYWDEMRDHRDPASSDVLTSKWIGGNGQGFYRCVPNGFQGNWTMT